MDLPLLKSLYFLGATVTLLSLGSLPVTFHFQSLAGGTTQRLLAPAQRSCSSTEHPDPIPAANPVAPEAPLRGATSPFEPAFSPQDAGGRLGGAHQQTLASMKGLQPERARSFLTGWWVLWQVHPMSWAPPPNVGPRPGAGCSSSAISRGKMQKLLSQPQLSLTVVSGLLSDSPADPQAGLLSLAAVQTGLSSAQGPAATQMFQLWRATMPSEAPSQEQTCLWADGRCPNTTPACQRHVRSLW